MSEQRPPGVDEDALLPNPLGEGVQDPREILLPPEYDSLEDFWAALSIPHHLYIDGKYRFKLESDALFVARIFIANPNQLVNFGDVERLGFVAYSPSHNRNAVTARGDFTRAVKRFTDNVSRGGPKLVTNYGAENRHRNYTFSPQDKRFDFLTQTELSRLELILRHNGVGDAYDRARDYDYLTAKRTVEDTHDFSDFAVSGLATRRAPRKRRSQRSINREKAQDKVPGALAQENLKAVDDGDELASYIDGDSRIRLQAAANNFYKRFLGDPNIRKEPSALKNLDHITLVTLGNIYFEGGRSLSISELMVRLHEQVGTSDIDENAMKIVIGRLTTFLRTSYAFGDRIERDDRPVESIPDRIAFRHRRINAWY